MNYFEMFGIPITLKVNKASLSQKYIALQKQFHPDYFANASPEEKEATLEQSSQINKAYKTFQSGDATIKYVLQLKGLIQEEEKFALPSDFLMEVMELNELKMEGTPAAEITAQAALLQQAIFEKVQPIIENYTDDATSEKELLEVKTYYYQKKYLDRLANSI